MQPQFSFPQREARSVPVCGDSHSTCVRGFISTRLGRRWISVAETVPGSLFLFASSLCLRASTAAIRSSVGWCRASAGRASRGEGEGGRGSVRSELTGWGRSLHCPGKCGPPAKVNGTCHSCIFCMI